LSPATDSCRPPPIHLEKEQIGILASRISIVSISMLSIAGAIIFYFVDEKKGKEEAALLGSS